MRFTHFPHVIEAGDVSKLLLAAKKIRSAKNTDFLISLVADDFSRASNVYVGKSRSNFLGTKFVVYDNQPPFDSTMHQKIYSKEVSSRVPVGNYKVATISYELNVLRTRGPRRMKCTMLLIPVSAIQKGGTAPTPATFGNGLDEKLSPLSDLNGKDHESSSTFLAEPLESFGSTGDPVILKNKAPRWHKQLQCWCLNFKGCVTVASVKNFQLVAAVDSFQNVPTAELEKVILQFGKIGKDIFTMYYCYPLSTFQAFSICLSSFDTKSACQ